MKQRGRIAICDFPDAATDLHIQYILGTYGAMALEQLSKVTQVLWSVTSEPLPGHTDPPARQQFKIRGFEDEKRCLSRPRHFRDFWKPELDSEGIG